MNTPPLTPGLPVRRRDGREYVVELVVGDRVFLVDAEGQVELFLAHDFRPLLEVVQAPTSPPAEGVEDFIARTLREATK